MIVDPEKEPRGSRTQNSTFTYAIVPSERPGSGAVATGVHASTHSGPASRFGPRLDFAQGAAKVVLNAAKATVGKIH